MAPALHPPRKAAGYRTLLDRTVAAGRLQARTLPDGSHLSILTAAGETVTIELHARTLEMDGQTWIYTIARDVTDQYEREQELKREKDRFEQFARVVSHDLRNPLNTAMARLQLIRDTREGVHVEELWAALDRMEALIGDLLEFARTGDLEREWVDLPALVRGCWENVDAAEVAFASDLESSIHADPRRLQQVLENLLGNAVEHGGDDVSIIIGELDDGLYVADSGTGIPASEREKVFDLGSSTDEDGTGFGLNVVERIVEEHGWSITVTEAVDGGTRFEITGAESR